MPCLYHPFYLLYNVWTGHRTHPVSTGGGKAAGTWSWFHVLRIMSQLPPPPSLSDSGPMLSFALHGCISSLLTAVHGCMHDWNERHWGRFCFSSSVSPANYHWTTCSISLSAIIQSSKSGSVTAWIPLHPKNKRFVQVHCTYILIHVPEAWSYSLGSFTRI
jgi:hypothetical protein